MKPNYQEVITISGLKVIQYEQDGVLYTIPKDPANSDYQRYLRHLAGEDDESGTL